MCNQRLLRSLHFRSDLNGGGIMFRSLLALLIVGQPVATHRLFNLLRPRIKRQRSKQNRKIFILRLLFFVSPLRYTQSRGSARALFRLYNQRLLRSLHFRFAHNGGGIMFRNLLALLIAGQPVATHRLTHKKKGLIIRPFGM